jgi:hypothetical protein
MGAFCHSAGCRVLLDGFCPLSGHARVGEVERRTADGARCVE